MKSTKDAAELYREIGRQFREFGADQVVLLSSKNDKETFEIIELQIAVEGIVNKKELETVCLKLWPQIRFELMIDDESDGGLLHQEMIEEGVRI